MKAITRCLFQSLAQSTRGCSGHSHHQQQGPNHENLTAYTHFGHAGYCSRWHCVKYRQKIIVVSIDIYLSAGMERRGVSSRPINSDIRRTVPLLKPPHSPHCYLRAVDHAKNFSPTPDHSASAVLSR